MPSHRHCLPLFGSLAVLAILAAPTSAGTITGHVEARGVTDEAAGDAGGGYGSRRYKFLERIDYSKLRNFVVNVDGVDAPPPADQPPPRATVTQRDGVFVPHVLPVLVGTEVDWPNADDVFHNVFCMAESTPFDLGLYKRGEQARSVVFSKTGRMEIFCSIHTKMSCIVLVLPNPWFSHANDKGHFVIPNVPAGTYKLRAWHERLPSKIKEVIVPADGIVEVNFVLGLGASAHD
ncbi:MAG: hypothetical protein HS122_15700 [Opitutaceae bacterium]|nr:hypothetical protein [Opitutaceae bacterium]